MARPFFFDQTCPAELVTGHGIDVRPTTLSALALSGVCIAVSFITAAGLGLSRLSVSVRWTGWSQGVALPIASSQVVRVPHLVTEYCEWRDYPTYDGNDTNHVERLVDKMRPSRAVARKANDEGALQHFGRKGNVRRLFPRMGVNSSSRHSLGTSTTASLGRRQKLSVDSQHPAE